MKAVASSQSEIPIRLGITIVDSDLARINARVSETRATGSTLSMKAGGMTTPRSAVDRNSKEMAGPIFSPYLWIVHPMILSDRLLVNNGPPPRCTI